jgi:DNA-binding LacI/PurR family transcriptional regulator
MVTMSDVAKAAGVSRATASYALRGDPRIVPETAEKVRTAARRLHYTANLSARSLRSGRNGVIGLAIFELDRAYPSEMGAAISREASRHGLQTIVQETSNSKEGEVSILRKVTSQLCDGMIFSPGNVSAEELRELSGGKPMVLLDDLSPDPVFDTVNTPCEAGAQAAIDHLIDVGCQDILVVGAHYESLAEDKQSTSVSARRLYGCLKAFDNHGMAVSPENFLYINWNPEDARALAHQVVRSGRRFDGVFCMTDTLAMGFIRGLADCGVHVPNDMAVIGFDGINESDYFVPSITTVSTDLNDLAAKAISLLLRRIDEDGADFEPEKLTADFRLIRRESTGR